jgi:hypothetical protein
MPSPCRAPSTPPASEMATTTRRVEKVMGTR